MDISSLKLSDLIDHRRESVRMVARFLMDDTAMTTLQMAHESGMVDESIRSATRLLHKHGLIHIDSWTKSEQVRAKPLPVWRAGSKPDAERPLKKKRTVEQRERQKEKQRLQRLAEKQVREAKKDEPDWNSIMNNFVKAHPLEK